MAMDNVLALFMLPLFGKFSDRTRTAIGRRMPYILGGTIGALLFLVLLPLAERTENLALFFIGLALVLISMATYRSPAVALMPDVTPKPLRSQGNAVINLMGAVGGMLMLAAMQFLLPGAKEGEAYRPNYLPIFIVLGVCMAVCVALLFWKINEPTCVAEMEAESAGLDEEPEREKNAGTGKSSRARSCAACFSSSPACAVVHGLQRRHVRLLALRHAGAAAAASP